MIGHLPRATLFAVLNIIYYSCAHSWQLLAAPESKEDAAKIDALPIDDRQFRVWGYINAVWAGVLPQVSQCTGSKEFANLLRNEFAVDTVTNQFQKSEIGRNAVFSKLYFPTIASLMERYQGHFDYAMTDFYIDDNAKSVDFKFFIVAERFCAVLLRSSLSKTQTQFSEHFCPSVQMIDGSSARRLS